MALTLESRQGLSEASLTISRQAASFWHPWQEISKRLKVHKGKCGLTCRGEAFKLISSFKSGGVSAFLALNFKQSRRCRLPANR